MNPEPVEKQLRTHDLEQLETACIAEYGGIHAATNQRAIHSPWRDLIESAEQALEALVPWVSKDLSRIVQADAPKLRFRLNLFCAALLSKE